jgi:hypothetical protein
MCRDEHHSHFTNLLHLKQTGGLMWRGAGADRGSPVTIETNSAADKVLNEKPARRWGWRVGAARPVEICKALDSGR